MAEERPVLVVEDDDALRDLLSMVVRDELGARVLAARNGQEALALLRDERPVLVVLDLMMPIVDGLEVCRRAKADPATCGIPLIAISAGARQAQAMAARCDDFLFKPFEYEELVATLWRWIDGHPRQDLNPRPSDPKSDALIH